MFLSLKHTKYCSGRSLLLILGNIEYTTLFPVFNIKLARYKMSPGYYITPPFVYELRKYET